MFIYLLIGSIAGLLAGWFLRGLRQPTADNRLENELREQVRTRESELATLRQELSNSVSARASAETGRDAAERLLADARQSLQQANELSTVARDKFETLLNSERQICASINTELATAKAELVAQQSLAVSIHETVAEQRRVHEQASVSAAATLSKVTADLDQMRTKVSETESGLVQAMAELKASNQSLADAQNILTESKQQRDKEIRKTEADSERLSAELRTSQIKVAQTGSEFATAQAQLLAERRALSEVRTERDGLISDRARLQEQVVELRNRTGELDAQVKFLTEAMATERKQIETIQARFQKEFEAISNKLLVDSSSKFNQQSSESLEKLLTPLRDNLTQFKTSLDTTRNEASAQHAVLKDSITRIGSEAANLAKALKGDAKVLGNWGENMLDQLLEKSGLQREVHYRRQRGAKDSEGEQRFLDVVIDLPEKRHLVIDSKVSLRSFEEMVNCTDDATRMRLLTQHVETTRRHFRELGEKRYHDTHGINAPDFVLMYIPIEAAYFSAIASEPKLFAEALERNVVLITNSTLLATLRTVSNVWRLADQQKNAIEIADRGGKLFDKFVGFVEDLKKVGDALNVGQQAWDSANSKLHTGSGNLVRQAQQLKDLGVKAGKTLPPVLVEQALTADETPQLPSPNTAL